MLIGADSLPFFLHIRCKLKDLKVENVSLMLGVVHTNTGFGFGFGFDLVLVLVLVGGFDGDDGNNDDDSLEDPDSVACAFPLPAFNGTAKNFILVGCGCGCG